MEDELWAPPKWAHTVMADKQCPQKWNNGQKTRALYINARH